LLKLGGAAAAAGVTGALLTEHAGTAMAVPHHADTVGFYQTWAGVGNIAIQGQGTSGATGVYAQSDSGYGLRAISTSGPGIVSEANGTFAVYGLSSGAGTGVLGYTGASGWGVVGEAGGNPAFDQNAGSVGVTGHDRTNSYIGIGVNGTSLNGFGVRGSSSNNYGVMGVSATSYGGYFRGGLAQIYLKPADSAGPPATGTHYFGEFFVDVNAVVWYCNGDGVPGTWVRLTGVSSTAAGGAISYLSTPVRLLDARSSASSGLVNRGALAGNEIYTFAVAGLGGSGIPASAQGLIGNVTILGPSSAGNLSLFPAGGAVPTVASMTFGQPGLFLANGVNVAIGSGGAINIQNQSSGTTPLVLDAVAYVS
jgi:hypothetical protein